MYESEILDGRINVSINYEDQVNSGELDIFFTEGEVFIAGNYDYAGTSLTLSPDDAIKFGKDLMLAGKRAKKLNK